MELVQKSFCIPSISTFRKKTVSDIFKMLMEFDNVTIKLQRISGQNFLLVSGEEGGVGRLAGVLDHVLVQQCLPTDDTSALFQI